SSETSRRRGAGGDQSQGHHRSRRQENDVPVRLYDYRNRRIGPSDQGACEERAGKAQRTGATRPGPGRRKNRGMGSSRSGGCHRSCDAAGHSHLLQPRAAMGRTAPVAASDHLEELASRRSPDRLDASSRLKLHILAIGHKPPDWVVSGFEDYARRMPREARIELTELKSAPRARKTPSAASISRILEAEKSCFLAALPPGCVRIALDERGKSLSTADLSRRFAVWLQEGR